MSGKQEEEKTAEEKPQTQSESTSQDADTKPQSQDSDGAEDTSQDAHTDEDKTPNVHKLERDIANRDKRIKKLEEQLSAKNATGDEFSKRLEALEKQLKDAEQEKADAKADAALTAAGRVDVELGRMALSLVDGDIEKLKETKPTSLEAKRSLSIRQESRQEAPLPGSFPRVREQLFHVYRKLCSTH